MHDIIGHPEGQEATVPVCLSGCERHFMRAEGTGDTYVVDVAYPPQPAPEMGYPLIILLDSGGCFNTCVEALRRMSRRPDATSVEAAVVVGISSPNADYDVPRRKRDFTTAEAPDGQTGGAPDFHRFISDQVKPFVASRVGIDPARHTLFGHSLAGYFTLWVMMNDPHSYRHFAAISPSIWWDKEGLMQAVSNLPASDSDVLMLMGEWEEDLPPWQKLAPGAEQVLERRGARQMVPAARELASHMADHWGAERVSFTVLPEEDHASIVSAAIPRMLRQASRT